MACPVDVSDMDGPAPAAAAPCTSPCVNPVLTMTMHVYCVAAFSVLRSMTLQCAGMLSSLAKMARTKQTARGKKKDQAAAADGEGGNVKYVLAGRRGQVLPHCVTLCSIRSCNTTQVRAVNPDGSLGPIQQRPKKSSGPRDTAPAGGISKDSACSKEELMEKIKDIQAKIEERKQWKPLLARPDGTPFGKGNIKKQKKAAHSKSVQLAARLAQLQAQLNGEGGGVDGGGAAEAPQNASSSVVTATAIAAAEDDGDEGDDDDEDDAFAADADAAEEVSFSSSDEQEGDIDE